MTYQAALFRLNDITEPAPSLRVPRRCDGCKHYREGRNPDAGLYGYPGLMQCDKDSIATYRAGNSLCDHGEFIDASA